MKRTDLLKRFQSYRCVLKREDEEHSLWQNPTTKQLQSLPKYNEFAPGLVRKICLGLSVPPL